MASWLVGRLVSGLGVATKAAAHPLARQASCETASGPVARFATSAWGRLPGPDQDPGGARWAFPGVAAAAWSSSSPAAAAAASPTAAAPDLSSASASGPASPNAALLLRRRPTTPTRAATHRVGPTTTTPIATAASFYTSVAAAAVTRQAAAPAAAGTAAAAAPARQTGASGADGASAAPPSGAAAPARAAAGGSDVAGEDAAVPLPAPKPDLVEKFLSLDVSNSGVRRQAERQQVLRDFQRHPADCGTPPVMVALWTHRVRSLVRVFDPARKQLPAIRQLEMLVNRRRRMLTWLRRSDFESYSYTISKLGLRDIYVPTGGEHRYREGVRQSDPVDDQINRLRFNFHTKYRQGKTSLWHRLRPKLVAEDPALQTADADAAVEDRQRRQRRREVAAQQRMAAERERETHK